MAEKSKRDFSSPSGSPSAASPIPTSPVPSPEPSPEQPLVPTPRATTPQPCPLKKDKGKKKDTAAATPALRDCANCGAPEGSIAGIKTHNACGRCKMTFYCARKCQKQHWKTGGHKEHCVKVADRRLAGRGGGGGGGIGSLGAAAEEPECAICLEALSQSPSQTLPCSHVYHRECVEKLRSFGISQACPMCRAELPPGPEKLQEDAMRRWFVLSRRYGQGSDRQWRRVTNGDDRRELADAMRMLHEAAEQGLPKAMFNYAAIHDDGQGLPMNVSTASEWYRKAADRGYAMAQHNLGVMFYYGKGVAQSHSTAMKWYRKAADQGDAKAECKLGVMYALGEGMAAPDLFEALRWLRRAVAQGNGQAAGLARAIEEKLRSCRVGEEQ